MDVSNLRIAMFSGNYNMVTDGANQALNRLVEYLLRQGAAVRVYSPTIAEPAFEPQGELVSLPSFAIPGRKEYRVATGLGSRVRRDLEAFRPNIVHISSPDPAAHRAVSYARRKNFPVLASVHTRFETYPAYYGLGFLEPVIVTLMRRFYRRCDALVAPAESFAQLLREQRMNSDIGIWSRGVDRAIFHPGARDMEWRQALGIADKEVAIGFLGRLVMEKGLDIFAEAMTELTRRNIAHRVLVVGIGPAQDWFAERAPEAVFAGFQSGNDLGRAVASMDIFLNPSVTETFGNVTLEAMACGVPVVAARATGSDVLVANGETGYLVPPRDTGAYADALADYITDPELRARHGAAGERRSLDYDWDRINQVVADTYLRLIAQRKAG
jgi:glycosyltransferase involved in cell wall biosynthesis